jgi:hypothetical protein
MAKLIPSTAKSTIIIIVMLIAGSISVVLVPELNRAVYAHTFTGEESASLLSVIKILQAENNLVQSNLASNLNLAQDHAKAIADVVRGNHTFGVLPDEVSENNKRVAADVIKAVDALRTTFNSKQKPSQADVKAKLDNLDAVLQEAVTVRVPKDHLSNSTVNAEATRDLVNETLRQYGYAHGISVGKGANTSSNANAVSAANSHNTIVNMSAYQSAQALASQAQSMISQIKTAVPANATNATSSVTATITTSAITRVDNDLSQLKNSIDVKSPYEKVANLVQKTIYPDLKAAFNL